MQSPLAREEGRNSLIVAFFATCFRGHKRERVGMRPIFPVIDVLFQVSRCGQTKLFLLLPSNNNDDGERNFWHDL